MPPTDIPALRKLISDAGKCYDIDFTYDDWDEYHLSKDEMKQVCAVMRALPALLAELEALRRRSGTFRFVDMTPDDGLAYRILSEYVDDTVFVAEPPKIAEMMNADREKRNALLRKAMDAVLDAARKATP